MNEDRRLLQECRSELRKIRDAMEVLAALATFSVILGFGFSGLIWPKADGLWAFAVWVGALIAPGYIVKGIRDRR
ncbi:MAG: hypothetical protein J7500_15625 [Sphingomonas sp.]|uniref:hypothetical protein n=1 Tax=Sphingomonas sp. TaxID=28214 RepID=UPI001B232B50|nr:hypothetical protein [Sphingomonas sp.]MBO9624137.1 hypothetical protein [Sphingomonas sp.]